RSNRYHELLPRSLKSDARCSLLCIRTEMSGASLRQHNSLSTRAHLRLQDGLPSPILRAKLVGPNKSAIYADRLQAHKTDTGEVSAQAANGGGAIWGVAVRRSGLKPHSFNRAAGIAAAKGCRQWIQKRP